MKKKGLIISTIVMVVVLIASLTTATYAWFSNDGSAKVSDVTFSVSSASDVKIGVAATNTYKSGAGFGDFYSEDTTYTKAGGTGKRNGTAAYGTWSGDNNDLGLNVTLPFNTWSPSKAVFSASARTLPVADDPGTQEDETVAGAVTLTNDGATPTPNLQFNPSAGYMILANGDGDDIDTDSIDDAAMNEDFLHIGFGAVAGATNVRGFGVWIYIDKADDGKPSVGILAGLHVCYRVNNGAWTDVDLYGGSYHQDTAISTMTAPSVPTLTISTNTYTYATDITPAQGDAALWIELGKASDLSTYCGTAAANIVQFEMVMYLDGTDSDTITTALKNNSAAIKVMFLAVNSNQVAD